MYVYLLVSTFWDTTDRHQAISVFFDYQIRCSWSLSFTVDTISPLPVYLDWILCFVWNNRIVYRYSGHSGKVFHRRALFICLMYLGYVWRFPLEGLWASLWMLFFTCVFELNESGWSLECLNCTSSVRTFSSGIFYTRASLVVNLI